MTKQITKNSYGQINAVLTILNHSNNSPSSWITIDPDKIKICQKDKLIEYRRLFFGNYILDDFDNNNAIRFYDDNAGKYNQAVKKFDNEIFNRIVSWFKSNLVPKDASIIDIGSGPGILASKLIKSGYNNIDLVDSSSRMLAFSKENTLLPVSHFKKCNIAKQELNKIMKKKYDIAITSRLLNDFYPTRNFFPVLTNIFNVLKRDGALLSLDLIPIQFETLFDRVYSQEFGFQENNGKAWTLIFSVCRHPIRSSVLSRLQSTISNIMSHQ